MKCNYCEWRCELAEGKFGVCKMYTLKEGHITERYPNRWSACAASRIESIPFYHAYPGSRSLVIGTMGCNFRCRYCSNGFVVDKDPADIESRMYQLTGKEVVNLAVKMGAQNIVFNVNEPTMSIPSLKGLKIQADKAGLPLGCLTNGYTTQEATEDLASIFTFFNIGLKGFSTDFYQKYIGVNSVDPVLNSIQMLATTALLEVTTPVIQDVNDSQLLDIARFLYDINPKIPWHVFRLLPEHDMKEEKYPDIEKINDTLAFAREKLPFIYFHNFVGSDWVNTSCPECGTEVIHRFSLGCGGDRLMENSCRKGKCTNCLADLNILENRPSEEEVTA